MKTLGLIGGTTWHSTVDYYTLINKLLNEKLGGLNSAKILLYSVNFEEYKPPDEIERWGIVADSLTEISLRLENAGAECIVMCANTPHLFADIIQKNIHIPVIHIAEATANEVSIQKLKKVGLLGTKFTMEQNFFKEKLLNKEIETVIPDSDEREFIHSIILTELGQGIINDRTKKGFLEIIDRLKDKGAEGIILGCTEIPLLIKKEDCNIPVFDTTFIHAKAAVEFALSN